MKITPDNKLKKLIVVGDRVLIKPAKQSDKADSGLYLPPGVQEKKRSRAAMLLKSVRVIHCHCRQMMTKCGKERTIR
jgi:chaperonin GroES